MPWLSMDRVALIRSFRCCRAAPGSTRYHRSDRTTRARPLSPRPMFSAGLPTHSPTFSVASAISSPAPEGFHAGVTFGSSYFETEIEMTAHSDHGLNDLRLLPHRSPMRAPVGQPGTPDQNVLPIEPVNAAYGRRANAEVTFAVIRSDYAMLEHRPAVQTEAFKYLQINGRDATTRDLATTGLNCDTRFLSEHRVVDRASGAGTFRA